jgi:endonuclease YncB( thermonuclease family)
MTRQIWPVILAALVAINAIILPGHAQIVQGVASVIDGDTIEIHGNRIRIHGIDAPESNQICATRAGKRWRCGKDAAHALADRLGRGSVRCVGRSYDRYRRLIAVCYRGSEDIAGWMVAQGWAVAFRRFSLDYVPEEEAAERARKGMWAGTFDMPWDWRAGNRTH